MNMDEIIKEAYRTIKSSQTREKVGNCLSEEDIVCFLDNVLGADDKNRILSHIISCKECAVLLKNHYQISNEVHGGELLEVPQHVVAEAKKLAKAPEKKNIFDIVLKIGEEIVEVINTTGKIIGRGLSPDPGLTLSMISLRSPDKRKDEGEVKVSQDLSGYVVDVEIEKQKPETANIVVRLANKESKKGVSGIRVSLISDERELESFLTDFGKVKFEGVNVNNYQVQLIEDDKVLGVINIFMSEK